MFRVAFDPDLPAVAAHPFNAKGKQFAAGDAVDWKALGISERIALDLWLAGTISHPVANTAPVSAGPSVTVPPPAPQPTKRSQRR